MKLTERLTGAFESVFLALTMVWTITITAALIQPQIERERIGVVEAHSSVVAQHGA